MKNVNLFRNDEKSNFAINKVYPKNSVKKLLPPSIPRITTKKINVNAVLKSIKNIDGDAGAIVVFTGAVRNYGKRGKVKSMYYDCYLKMAENQIKHIEKRIIDKWDIKHIRIIHRIGKLTLGANSIVIVISTPHSKDAFEACKYALKKIKQEVPIWKMEIMSNGQSRWVEGNLLKIYKR